MTITDPTLRGLVAGRSGASFERDLDFVHDLYRRDGVATVNRLPVPTVPIPPAWLTEHGRLQCGGMARRLASRQGYDYSGWFGRRGGTDEEPAAYAGHCIAMEAKVSGKRKSSIAVVPENVKGSGVQIHQLRALADAARDGAIACLVWRCGDPHSRDDAETFRGVLLPPAIIAAVEAFDRDGRRSIPRHEFTPYTLLPRTDIEDWLFPVRCWMEKARTRA